MGMDAVCLAKYPQVAAINHVHTPGNSSGIVDGASAVLIGSEAIGQQLGLTPRGRIVAMATISTEPTTMQAAPEPADDRKSTAQGKSEAVRVELGGTRHLTQKTTHLHNRQPSK